MGLFDNASAAWKAWKLYRWYKEGGLSCMDWSKLKSRKLWYLIIASLAVTILAVHGAPKEVLDSIAALAVTYLGVQSAVDLSGGERDWRSRKLWASAGGSVILTVLAYANMPHELVESIRWFIMTYLGGQGAVDLMAARKAKK